MKYLIIGLIAAAVLLAQDHDYYARITELTGPVAQLGVKRFTDQVGTCYVYKDAISCFKN
jgi:hypothetical protein